MEETLERPLPTPRPHFEDRSAAAKLPRLLTDAHALQLAQSVDRITRTLFRYDRRREAEQQLHTYFDDLLNNSPDNIYYEAYKLREYVRRMRSCRCEGAVGIRPDGRPVIAWKEKCGCLRLCPDEARQDQVRVIKQYLSAILAAKRGGLRLYKMVLSPPNYPRGQLREAKREVFAMWRAVCRKMRHKEVALAGIKGMLVVQEDPMGAHGDWNVHLNVIILYDGWLDYEKFRTLWPWSCKIASEKDMRAATRAVLADRGVNVARMDNDELLVHAIKECVKYPVQAVSEKANRHADTASAWVDGDYLDYNGEPIAPPITAWPRGAAMEWWDANLGFRRVRSYGILYDCRKPKLPDELDDGTHWVGCVVYYDSTGYDFTAWWLPTEFQRSLLPSIRRGTSRQESDVDPPGTGPPYTDQELATALSVKAMRAYYTAHPEILKQRLADEESVRQLAVAVSRTDAILGQWRHAAAEFTDLFGSEPEEVFHPPTRANLHEYTH